MDTHGSDLEFACLCAIEQIREIEADWRALEVRSVSEMAYFQSYDWCMKWWSAIGASSNGQAAPDIRIFTARRNGELVMLWPMMAVKRAPGLKKLVRIGDGLSQYGGILADSKKVSADDIAACWSFISKQSDISVILMDYIPENTLLARSLAGRGSCAARDETSIIDLSGIRSRSELQSALPSAKRRSMVKRRKKLADGKSLELVAYKGGSDDYRRTVDLGFEWKAVWLQKTGRFSKFLTDPRTRDFIAELSDGAVALVLQRDGVPVAMEIGFIRGEHFYSYLGAFDWSLRRLSPGRVQMDEAFGWMIDQKLRYYDLLGNPSTHKQELSNHSIVLNTYSCPISLSGYIYVNFWRYAARPLIKQFFYGMSTSARRRLLNTLTRLRETAGGVNTNEPLANKSK